VLTRTPEEFKEFSNTKVFRVLREGKWVVLPLKGAQNIDGTRAEVVPVKSVMSFPKYLKAKYGS